ncbi:MAG TPA: metalloregulator ArsR/SmtB family transcription factor, partial [Capsulimonadaceae bacterium]|nr:metalloregulator ArsR/SmtB family transcription factor [Capsulimonadaceae bacterium]
MKLPESSIAAETIPKTLRYHENMTDQQRGRESENLPVASVAGLIGDPARAAILSALVDGKALPAGELAQRARVTPQTASAHLNKLVDGNLLAVESCGRHRYYRLAGSEVAQALEALAALSSLKSHRGKPLSDPRKEELRFARTCYDHLAGKLAVAITNALTEKGLLRPGGGHDWLLSEDGETLFGEWGIDIAALRGANRAFARTCLDWTERRHHIAGTLGAELLRAML